MDADDLLDLFDRLAAEVARALGELEDWGPSGQRATQYRHDVVADEILLEGLRAEGLAVLSEESGLAGAAEVTVVVDPVDGSTNGSRGVPWYATSLCAVDADGPLASLVVNLATGVRYRAVRGRGARLDRSPIVVEQQASGASPSPLHRLGASFDESRPIRPSGCEALDDAIVGFSGLPPRHGGWRQFRALGAAALDLCAVADGTLDAYVDVDGAHGVWDYLGAWLVCVEAGAAIGELVGEELVALDPSARRGPVAAAGQNLLDQVLAMTRNQG